MFRFIVQRCLLAASVALVASLVTFALLNFAVDPAAALAGETDDPRVVEQLRQQMGLDRPAPERYLEWLSGLVAGELGISFTTRQPVLELIAEHAPVTLRLAGLSMLVTLAIALPLGIGAALRPTSRVDRIAQATAAALQASPNFWIGLLLILVFSVQLGWLPVSGDAGWTSYVLPALVLGKGSVPNVMRLARSGMMEVLASDFIRTARAKGFGGWALLRSHALRNAMLPVVSMLMIELGNKLGGSVVTEVVFAMNGIGRLALNSVLSGDIPTLQMIVLMMAVVFVGMTLLADLINAWLDPRIRLS